MHTTYYALRSATEAARPLSCPVVGLLDAFNSHRSEAGAFAADVRLEMTHGK
jgi:hypothetical protein